MKDEILSIACDLKEGSMSLNEAKKKLILLLNDSVNVKVMQGELIKKSGFTPTNKNHLTIEVLGEENFIMNNLDNGDKLELLYFR